MIEAILNKAERGEELKPAELVRLLDISDSGELKALFESAYRVKEQQVGKVVYFRGLIECSNICRKDCYYCGIRKSNKHAHRFQMNEIEIVNEALWSYEQGYGSAVIQAGERRDTAFIQMIARVLRRIQAETGGQLGMTLSLGEQSSETYRLWHEAGAHRYLLRIETTNQNLYRKLHPKSHSFQARLKCLQALKETGYQVGTGVMVGLPGQTTTDLVNDLLFMKSIDIDMVGMGPYIPHNDTPMGQDIRLFGSTEKEAALIQGLKMIAVTRLVLKDVNIAATTSLQALAPDGRERGIKSGANVIMPSVTQSEFRPHYQLYNGKPCMDENAQTSRDSLSRSIHSLGEKIGFNQRGDAKHFCKRVRTINSH